MKKKNILIWYWGRRGGGPLFTLLLTKEFVKYNSINVFISVSKQSERYQDFEELNIKSFNVNTYTGKLSGLLALFKLKKRREEFRKFLIDNKIELVICPFSHLWNVYFHKAIKETKTKLCLVVHDAQPHPGEDYFLMRFLLKREILNADALITLSDHVKQRVKKILDKETKPILVVTHGVFDFSGKKSRENISQKKENTVLLFFGRLLAYKGLDLLLEAFQLLEKKHSDLILKIAGQGKVKMKHPVIEDTRKVFIFNQWIPEKEIDTYFSNAHIVVLPYIESSQSGVIPIAAAYGLPVVVTPVGGLIEQVKDRKTGLIAKAISPDALAESISLLLEDKSLYNTCSEGAYEYAKMELAWNKIADKIVNFIQEKI